MIREATENDLPSICSLASQSLIDGPYAGIIKDVPAQAEKCAKMVMANGKIFLAEEDGEAIGVLGFLFAHHHFSNQPYAAELMWYVLTNHRKGGAAIQLLWAAEKAAKEMGAEDFCFSAPNEDVAALYKRFGYSKMEVTYRKRLSCHS